jgi:hypothetical protein
MEKSNQKAESQMESSENKQINVGIRKMHVPIDPKMIKNFGMKTFPASAVFGRRRNANTPLTMSGMSAKVKIRITYSIESSF